MSSEPAGHTGQKPPAARAATGLILVAGPSGAGKDTLIQLAVDMLDAGPRLHVARRTVTRPANAFEDHASLDLADFERDERAGRFALSWRAHGLAYGIPHCEIARPGALVLISISRTVIETGRGLWPGTSVVLITAPPDVLAHRITARGRDTSLKSRLARIGLDDALATKADLTIENVGPPESGARKLADFIRSRLMA